MLCDHTFILLLFPQYLKLMQRNINLNNKQKHMDVITMTTLQKSAVHCIAGSLEHYCTSVKTNKTGTVKH